jgi:hypothetical protein
MVTGIALFIGGMLTGCSSPTAVEDECVYSPDLGKWVGPGCEAETNEIVEQKGPPRFVCNSNKNAPPWCDDNNWTEDLPPGQQP